MNLFAFNDSDTTVLNLDHILGLAKSRDHFIDATTHKLDYDYYIRVRCLVQNEVTFMFLHYGRSADGEAKRDADLARVRGLCS